MRKPTTHDSVEEALKATARLYRKNLWLDADDYVEIWLEKDALAGVVYPVTSMYDVPLIVARGYASLSFLYSAAEYIKTLDVPAYIYHLVRSVRRQRRQEDRRDAARDGTGCRPKVSDARAKAFGSTLSVELDAIEPNQLRALQITVLCRSCEPACRNLRSCEACGSQTPTTLMDRPPASRVE